MIVSQWRIMNGIEFQVVAAGMLVLGFRLALKIINAGLGLGLMTCCLINITGTNTTHRYLYN